MHWLINIAAWTSTLGHLHPLLVHLPIGILLFALVITLLSPQQRESMATALRLALMLAALSALMAGATGMALSQSGDYEADLVVKHQWSGIITAILCLAALWVKPWRRPLVWCASTALVITGHWGGVLTHGEDYLFGEDEDAPVAEAVLPAGKSAIVSPQDSTLQASTVIRQVVFPFQQDIQPILKSKCYNCHSATKKKGGLRLDSEAFIRKGGKNGLIFKPGNPEKSPLYAHLVLPMDDEQHMPPKGKKQPTRMEIGLIRRWILQGAPFGPVEEAAGENAPATVVVPAAPEVMDSPEGMQSQRAVSAQAKAESIPAALPSDLPAADEAVVAALRQRGIMVNEMPGTGKGLSVNLVNLARANLSLVDTLNLLQPQLVELKMTGQPVTDEYLSEMQSFPHLRRLHLEKTGITDKGLTALSRFPELTVLNVYGTAITDQGLRSLHGLKGLRRIYLWQTHTTPEGIAALQQAVPGLIIESGRFSFVRPDTLHKK